MDFNTIYRLIVNVLIEHIIFAVRLQALKSIIMLSEEEKKYLVYWEANREREKKVVKQLIIGVPMGLIFAIPILIAVFSSKFWYKRADAVANTQTSPAVLIIAIIVITAFVAIFYKRHQWEMKEQQYQEIKNKEKRESGTV